MNRIALLLIPFMCLTFDFADAQGKLRKEADEYYAYGNYRMALEKYKEFEKKSDELSLEVKERIADCLRQSYYYEKAEKAYAELYEMDSVSAKSVLEYAHILRNNEKYEKAGEVYQKYSQMKPNDSRGLFFQEAASWAAGSKDIEKNIRLKLLPLETGGLSLGMTLYDDGLIFSKPHEGEEGEQGEQEQTYYNLAYVAKNGEISFKQSESSDKNITVRPHILYMSAENSIFDDPKELEGEVNSTFHDGSPCITNNGKYLYFTSNASDKQEYKERKRKKHSINEQGENVLKIFRVENADGKWENLKELNFNSLDYNCAHPSLSSDGDSLFFVSDMSGGRGGYDIYLTTKNAEGEWGPPENVGGTVNTVEDEQFPYYAKDGTLYFSSFAHFNYGGYDIFKSSLTEDGTWGKVKNLGRPINSSKDDIAFVLNEDGMSGYLASNRKGANGYDRIYAFKDLDLPDSLAGKVLNKVSDKPIEGVKVNLVAKNGSGSDKEMITNDNGKYDLTLQKENSYELSFEAEGYEPKKVQIPRNTLDDLKDILAKVKLDPKAEKDNVIEIDNMYFDYGESSLSNRSEKILDKVVDFLEENPEVKVELSAHTDSQSSANFNRQLSQKRAESCVEYLTSKGIDSNRLVPKGYGESKLVNHCKDGVECSEEEHRENRRVEVKIL